MFEQEENVEMSGEDCGTSTLQSKPTVSRRKTRMQTRAAAREEMRQLQQSPTDTDTPTEHVILTTRYPIRKQLVAVDYCPKNVFRRPKTPFSTKGKYQNTSTKPPVTRESHEAQQINPSAPVARRLPRTKNKRVQTEYRVTENEMKLLQSLRAKHMDVEKIKIISNKREHILMMNDEEEDLEEIVIPPPRAPSPPLQVPMLPPPLMNLFPPNISSTFFCHDVSRYCDDEPLAELSRMSSHPMNFMQTAAHYLNSQLHNNPHNLNQYGMPRWFPKPDLFPLHAPWGT